MKEEETDLGKLFLSVTIMPAFLVVAVFFFAGSNIWLANEVEAIKFGYNCSLGILIVSVVYLVIFAPEEDYKYLPLLSVAITTLAVASLIFGLGNAIFLVITACLGLLFSLVFAHYLKGKNTSNSKLYKFILFVTLVGCIVNVIIGLTLRGDI
jgi:hypothetical protein